MPIKGFRAINLFGIIFARKEFGNLDEEIILHEKIHSRQMIEMLIVGFYSWYIIEWIIKWVIYKDSKVAYNNISFEREAYRNHHNANYLNNRRWYNFINYII